MAFDEDWDENNVVYASVEVRGLVEIRNILERIAVALEEINIVVQEQRDPQYQADISRDTGAGVHLEETHE